jgi:transcription elongation factor Elf1
MIVRSLEFDRTTQEKIYRCPECGHEETVSKKLDADT